MNLRIKIISIISGLSLIIVCTLIILTTVSLRNIKKTIDEMARQNEESIKTSLLQNLNNEQEKLVKEGMADVEVFIEEAQLRYLENIKNIKMGQDGFIIILKKDQDMNIDVIYNSRQQQTGISPDDFQDILGKEIRQIKHVSDTAYYLTSGYNEKWNWQICIFNNTNEIFTPYNKIRRNLSENILLIIISIIVAFTILYSLISRGIIKPILKVSDHLTAITEGSLEEDIITGRKDEIGIMMQNLQKMVVKLKQIVLDVVSASKNIDLFSQQMDSFAQNYVQGSIIHAESVSEVSESMKEMIENIQQNTENAQQTEKISHTASSSVKEGYKSFQISVEAMKNIASKITIINDIAFQTNILALNAAVEAARAGQYGKGFAVVAAEVRKLAENSKKAADEIIKLSGSGVNISVEAGEKLAKIVPEIEKTATLVMEISAANIEQNASTDKISTSINKLHSISQKNATTANEMTSNANELEQLAKKLNKTISFFNMTKTNTTKSQKDNQVNLTNTSDNESQKTKGTAEDKSMKQEIVF